MSNTYSKQAQNYRYAIRTVIRDSEAPDASGDVMEGLLSKAASISANNATNKSVTWTSSNRAVATVNRGFVKARKAGTATIYAVSSNGKKATDIDFFR